MKRLTAFFVMFLLIIVLAVNGCAPSSSPIATPEMPAPAPSPPTATAGPPTLTMAPPTPTPLPPPPTTALPTPTQLPPTPVPQVRTLQVTSSADNGPGTLRQALLDARRGDIITFDPSVFPPDAPVTITLSSGLPELNQGNLTLDASNAGVILDGSKITTPQSVHGLSIPSNNNTIRGLQIAGFSDAGIALHSGAKYNVIGGDRGAGSGPLGQGNLVSGNGNFGIGLWGEGTSHNTIQGNYIGINLDGTATWGHPRDGIHSNGANYNLITGNVIGGNDSGVYLCCVEDGKNTVTANFIGTDASGTNHLGNNLAGVLVDRTSYNVIGPGNIIAYNIGQGIMFWEDTPYNTVTQNSIHDNGELGISLDSGRSDKLAPPLIFEFDLQTGNLAGCACANCIVEIFSDSGDEGAIYEGQVVSDSRGIFAFSKGGALTGPYLTVTASDPNGNTSQFSVPTSGPGRSITIQAGNSLPKIRLETRPSSELADNRIGSSYAGGGLWRDVNNLDSTLNEITDLGVKRVDTSLYEIEPPIDWSVSEYDIPTEFDQFIDNLAENGVAVNYILHFWDKAGHANGKELSTPRFKTAEQVQDFLDYVRFVAGHFKGRVQYYTIWSEPDNCGPPQIKCIEPNDYINLARQTIPVIRQEDPQAKVVLAPNVLFFARDYLFTLLNSDVMPLFDVISWHPMYDAAPDIEFFGGYYYEYPSIIQEIKQTASAHGFQGEYWGTELTWCSEEFPACKPADQPWGVHNDIQSAKYYARGIVMQLGLDVGVGLGGFQKYALWSYPTIRNLNTVMAGARPVSLTGNTQGKATNIVSYSFSLPDGDRLFALWTNGPAVDDDPGVSTALTFPGLSAQKVIGIDVLDGFEQELIAETENGNLTIPNLLVKDYPIIVRLID
jgi:hypothetical protein